MLRRVQVVHGHRSKPGGIYHLHMREEVFPPLIAELDGLSLRVKPGKEQTQESDSESIIRHRMWPHLLALRVNPVEIVCDPLMESKDGMRDFWETRLARRFGNPKLHSPVA